MQVPEDVLQWPGLAISVAKSTSVSIIDLGLGLPTEVISINIFLLYHQYDPRVQWYSMPRRN